MDIFRDPVMTPSGLSYERSALTEHLHKVGTRINAWRYPSACDLFIHWSKTGLKVLVMFLQVGKFDPVTREAMSLNHIVTNMGLRSATQQFLDDHPWAWEECM
eukprot:scaffold120209_cov26-Prasinocladus_malaysianus.AAC.1